MGTLYIVATPIGNLKDITLRAIEILKNVNYILCEDTRVSGKLLNAYDIHTKILSFNDFNEELRVPQIINDLLGGQSIALVSDAGTPLISDPGYKLVRKCVESGIRVESIAGPSAAIVALTVSGKPPDKFLFMGYLPKKEGKRREVLNKINQVLQTIKTTVIMYESPYRLVKTLVDIKEVLGDIDVVICREMTKLHEEIRREKVSSAIEHFSKVVPRGEFTILL